MPTSNFETVLRAFRVFDGFDGPSTDDLWWRTGEGYGPVTLFVNCNDFFHWGCSDCEEITDENIGELENALTDCLAIDDMQGMYAGLLFCARQRKMRPQGAYYNYLDEKVHHLFDACGELRETGFGNPTKHPSERTDQ